MLKSESQNQLNSANIREEIIFTPSNNHLKFLLFGLSLLAIMSLYYTIFLHPWFLVMLIPMTLMMIWVFVVIRNNRHPMVLSPYGIKCERLRNLIGKDTLAWHEISSVSVSALRGNYVTVMVKLKDRAVSSVLDKISNLNYDVNLKTVLYKNTDHLNELIFRMHDLYKTKI